MASQPSEFEIEVVYALPDEQWLRRVTVAPGCTAAQAIAKAGLLPQWQPMSGSAMSLARFGRLITADTLLAAEDRVEILRPLSADPQQQRHARVAAERKRRQKN